MTKAAVIVLADTETHGDLARVVNAMMTAKEFAEAGDDVELMLMAPEPSGSACLPDPGHKSHRLFQQGSRRHLGCVRVLLPRIRRRSGGPSRRRVFPGRVQGSPQRPTARWKKDARSSPSDPLGSTMLSRKMHLLTQ